MGRDFGSTLHQSWEKTVSHTYLGKKLHPEVQMSTESEKFEITEEMYSKEKYSVTWEQFMEVKLL